MTRTESLLTDAKKAVVDWGRSVRRSYGDEHGDFVSGRRKPSGPL